MGLSRIFYCPTTPQFINDVLLLAMFAPSNKNIWIPMTVCFCACINMCVAGSACAPRKPFFPVSPLPSCHRICQCIECGTRALASLFEAAVVVCAKMPQLKQSHSQQLKPWIAVPLNMSNTHLLGFKKSHWNMIFATLVTGLNIWQGEYVGELCIKVHAVVFLPLKPCCKWSFAFIYSQETLSGLWAIRDPDHITKWTCSPRIYMQCQY